MKLEQFNDLSRRCCGGRVSQEHISQEVEKIACQQPNRAKIYLGSVLAASGFAMFFGGTLLDAIMTAIFAVMILRVWVISVPFSVTIVMMMQDVMTKAWISAAP